METEYGSTVYSYKASGKHSFAFKNASQDDKAKSHRNGPKQTEYWLILTVLSFIS